MTSLRFKDDDDLEKNKLRILYYRASMFLPKQIVLTYELRNHLVGTWPSLLAEIAGAGHSLYFRCVSLYRTQIIEQLPLSDGPFKLISTLNPR